MKREVIGICGVAVVASSVWIGHAIGSRNAPYAAAGEALPEAKATMERLAARKPILVDDMVANVAEVIEQEKLYTQGSEETLDLFSELKERGYPEAVLRSVLEWEVALPTQRKIDDLKTEYWRDHRSAIGRLQQQQDMRMDEVFAEKFGALDPRKVEKITETLAQSKPYEAMPTLQSANMGAKQFSETMGMSPEEYLDIVRQESPIAEQLRANLGDMELAKEDFDFVLDEFLNERSLSNFARKMHEAYGEEMGDMVSRRAFLRNEDDIRFADERNLDYQQTLQLTMARRDMETPRPGDLRPTRNADGSVNGEALYGLFEERNEEFLRRRAEAFSEKN